MNHQLQSYELWHKGPYNWKRAGTLPATSTEQELRDAKMGADCKVKIKPRFARSS